MKKFSVATITSILLLIGIVAGSIYYEKYIIEHIVKSDKAKTAIENMLKDIDDKALTPERIIKSYKIDYSKVRKNPMGGINIIIIVNNDDELFIETTLSKYSQNGNYEMGGLGVSRKLSELGIPREKE